MIWVYFIARLPQFGLNRNRLWINNQHTYVTIKYLSTQRIDSTQLDEDLKMRFLRLKITVEPKIREKIASNHLHRSNRTLQNILLLLFIEYWTKTFTFGILKILLRFRQSHTKENFANTIWIDIKKNNFSILR